MPTTLADTRNASAIFWGEIAPCEHLVQIYEEDGVFLDALEGFIGGGLIAGDGVAVIATPSHMAALEERLVLRGLDLRGAQSRGQYVALDTRQALSKFMVDDWPDEVRFRAFVSDVLERAGRDGRRVRAFGEMVAVLWGQGRNGATVRLEHLWHELCRERLFSLFCSYPRAGFTRDAAASIREICETHSRVVC